MTTDLATEYGPNKPCQRTACAAAEPHLGGVHLDPRSPLYDGPDITVNALNAVARSACRKLLAAGASVPEVVDLANEIHQLRDQVAAVRVDKDRQVRAAGVRALDCEEHGKDIARLEEQLTHSDNSARQNDAGRVALLNGFFALEDAITMLRDKIKRGDPVPELGKVLEVFSGVIERTNAAHKRAWSK
jgi:hypothetical protein